MSSFCRMWEFYLAGSETAFRYQNLVVFQVQLVKRIGALPTTRDYMLTDERRLLRAGADRGPAAHGGRIGARLPIRALKRILGAMCIAVMRRIDRRGIG